MATYRKLDLIDQLTQRVSSAMQAAAHDTPDVLDPGGRALLDEDIRLLTNNVADRYFGGGDLPIAPFVDAYQRYVSTALTDADVSPRDGLLEPHEQSTLPPVVQAGIAALRVWSPPVVPPPVTPPPASSSGALGISGTMAPSEVSFRTVVDSGLNRPTGIAFHPRTNDLWILNRDDDSSVVVSRATSENPRTRKYRDDSDHFMNNPMGLAFSPVYDEFASVQETTNDYNRGGRGNMFMGPTLWPADRTYDGGHDSHLDMVHHSPNSVGITAGTEYPSEREYWVFNGDSNCIDRYFFRQPHVHGGTDHADGLTVRYGSGLQRTANVPSHLALDSETGVLYIADTGNGRIATLDTTPGLNNASRTRGHHDETPLFRLQGAQIKSLTGRSAGLVAPSGLVLHEDHLIVSDYGTGHIKVLTKSGEVVGDLDTGFGANAITGLALGPNGKLFIADGRNDRVVELTV